MREDYLDIPFSRPGRLLDSKIEEACEKLAKYITCENTQVTYSFDDGRKIIGSSEKVINDRIRSITNERYLGYVFYYQPSPDVAVPIAHLYYINGGYHDILLYSAAIQSLKLELHEERVRESEERKRLLKEKEEKRVERLRLRNKKKKRKFILQKAGVAVCLTISAVVALKGCGAIYDAVTKEPTEIVQQEQTLNTVANANDLLLFTWSHYAMSGVSERTVNSEHDSFVALGETIRTDYFIPVMSSYYSYMEQQELDLPQELVGESIKNVHNAFRNYAYLLDEKLQQEGFTDCIFSKSPFANAIVVDSYGNVVGSSSPGLFGEVYDTNGELVTFENEILYIVYVRADDVIGNDYGNSNYPDDAIMFEGIAYVDSAHLNDFEAPAMGTK